MPLRNMARARMVDDAVGDLAEDPRVNDAECRADLDGDPREDGRPERLATKTTIHSRSSELTEARPPSVGSTARVVCSVKSSDRPRITKMNPTEYMLASSKSTRPPRATYLQRASA